MSLPGNGIFILRGEVSTLLTAINRSKWATNSSSLNEEESSILKSLHDLKSLLLRSDDLCEIPCKTYLDPFLRIIKSDKTSGTVTGLALSTIYKVLTYGLLTDVSEIAEIVEKIADTVTHTRFVGADVASDGAVLLKVVQILRLLMVNPEGKFLSNESICEIMLSCFRICFEPKMNDLLRRTAETALKDMVLAIFVQLPTFVEDTGSSMKPFKIGGNLTGIDGNAKTLSKSQSNVKIEVTDAEQSAVPTSPDPNSVVADKNPASPTLMTTPMPTSGRIIDIQGQPGGVTPKSALINGRIKSPRTPSRLREVAVLEDEVAENEENPEESLVEPYGLPCVRELFRFLILMCDPLDKQNTDTMIHTGLSLLMVAFEVSSNHISHFPSLLSLVQNECCRNLIALLDTERLSIFAAALQVSFLIYESMRGYLKFQLEKYLLKLSSVIGNESGRTQHEARELALENLLQLWRIPSLLTEIYINYDCDFYCANILKDSIQQISKFVVAATNWSDNTYLLHVEAILTVVDAISKYCIRGGNGVQVMLQEELQKLKTVNGNEGTPKAAPQCTLDIARHEPKFQIGGRTILFGIQKENLVEIERKKAILGQGIELFNKHPDRGIQFLQEHNILKTPIDPEEIVMFLKEHPLLDKKVIGEFISKKKNVEAKILKAFVQSFNFRGLSIDTALRAYLEAFRLPGEAPLIFLVMEEFAEYWHTQNGNPFANTDAAFRLAYAIIMLNMDQHNQNAKRLNIPMTEEDFIKNLRGLNGDKKDFDENLLISIYNSIKNEEICLPAEHAGPVRDNYLWQVMLRRGSGPEGIFYHSFEPVYMEMIFRAAAKVAIGVLSMTIERGGDIPLYEKTRAAFVQTAYLCSLYHMNDELDSLVLSLCKLTMLLGSNPEGVRIANYTAFGQSIRSQITTQTLFEIIHLYGNGVRQGWKYIIDILVRLFKLKLLPETFVVVEDFCEPDGKFSLVKDSDKDPKADAGLFSSLYTYLSAESQPKGANEEDPLLTAAKNCVEKCNLDVIFSQSKLLSFNALEEVVEYLMSVIKCPKKQLSDKGQPIPDDILTFSLEMLVKILAQSNEQLSPVWNKVSTDLFQVLTCSAECNCDYIMHRLNSAILRISINAMRNEEMCPDVLTTMNMFMSLSPQTVYKISLQVATGVHKMLENSAQNIHTEKEWSIVLSILEYYGAGVMPEPDGGESVQLNAISYPCKLIKHSPAAFKKTFNAMSFTIRNLSHITPYNFERCVASMRKFMEAALSGQQLVTPTQRQTSGGKARSHPASDDEEFLEDMSEQHQNLVTQLLDLMHTLHAKTAQIYRWWAEEGGSMPHCSVLWRQGWCPLLQGMARAGFDKRKDIRMSAIACLQRALLVHDLETLTGLEWSSCLQDVLFPLLKHLISYNPAPQEFNSVEEARSRTTSMMCKVFLHHLQPLLLLPNINQLWMDILSYIECLTKIGSDELVEAVKESLKNMLLVMRSIKIFTDAEESNSQFWDLTWNRLDQFLPNLKHELIEQDLFVDNTKVVQRQISIPSPTELLHQKLESKEQSNTITIVKPMPIQMPSQPVLLPPTSPESSSPPMTQSPLSQSPPVSHPEPILQERFLLSEPHETKIDPEIVPEPQPTIPETTHDDDEAFVSIEKVSPQHILHNIQQLNGTDTRSAQDFMEANYCETRETILNLNLDLEADDKPAIGVFSPSAYFNNAFGNATNDFLQSTQQEGTKEVDPRPTFY
ncbi:LOW QUALITY PROTEIN: Golgi-specific brefeldin A-resistance guanine nucleotide exchange factor 1-like [Culicoides brevitarsis]|uniref:LOW QUALITY PROTEIN: Golgi-specific brefeldin A-resistance guanine nucleotide exchange factor 1-like n=1 Tax=Culicoides brevitarsis TaxID=469753 RepID=UPI00307C9051